MVNLTNDQAAAVLLGPPAPTAAPKTAEELDWREQRRELRRQLADLNEKIRRPALIVENPEEDREDRPWALACPFCLSHALTYDEDVIASQQLDGIDDGDRVIVDSDTDHTDDGDDARLFCSECMEESRIPEHLEIEWQ